ncbi:Similar to znf395: Zinc finger protein 395 (Xenopus laevis) [Cotesia congregata]|uniref:Similar to znf395: Zinc finger protein 395 (Xenopus laevis) n=1 Tax=Cotesia congregata TaxID=51543 RepID=A0A8J2MG07_COTCN|nr:Similar to znf395: Zinc finger protein 395 (Xenopus laevis) [Cotesia congregata]
MSTGKRLAKRSIIGTRVCAPGNDGMYYSGVIHAVKTPASTIASESAGLRITPKTRYSVRFDPVPGTARPPSPSTEFADRDLIGPGFGSVTSARLVPGQRVYLTFNGREVNAQVTQHREHLDEVDVVFAPTGQEGTMRLTKRIDEIRLLESRKSARLADQDTDFARLADMAGDRKRASSHSIDVPHVPGSRKRRPSSGNESDRSSYSGCCVTENGVKICHNSKCCGRAPESRNREGGMDECTAALVLMSLSCSPHSPNHPLQQCSSQFQCSRNNRMSEVVVGTPSSHSNSSCDASWRTGTPSPTLSEDAVPLTSSPPGSSTWPVHSRPGTSRNSEDLFVNKSDGSSGSTPTSGTCDEGIVMDLEDYLEEMQPRKKKRDFKNASDRQSPTLKTKSYEFDKSETVSMVFKCTWPGCTEIRTTCPQIEKHVRQTHLGPKKVQDDDDEDEALSDHEEEFYYQEIAVNHMSSPPTMSHRDMARPPHEDPEYQKQLRLEVKQPPAVVVPTNNSTGQISKDRFFNFRISPIRPRSPATPIKSMKQARQLNHQNMNIVTAVTATLGKTPLNSMPRRARGDTKKCRKVYGMENREQWCTQCKWKKACNRFIANA